jgi:hypothetical protein
MHRTGRPTCASLFGLAPCGVLPATDVATGAVRSYRTFSPLPGVAGRYIFCATFLRVAPTGRYPAHCPAEFGLSSSPSPFRAAVRRSPGPLRRLRAAAVGRKPNSVPRLRSPCRELWRGDDHSSSPAIAGGIKRPTRMPRTGRPTCASLFGLAPCGVLPATDVATGAVRSYRTFSPLPLDSGAAPPGGPAGGGVFFWTINSCWPPPGGPPPPPAAVGRLTKPPKTPHTPPQKRQ